MKEGDVIVFGPRFRTARTGTYKKRFHPEPAPASSRQSTSLRSAYELNHFHIFKNGCVNGLQNCLGLRTHASQVYSVAVLDVSHRLSGRYQFCRIFFLPGIRRHKSSPLLGDCRRTTSVRSRFRENLSRNFALQRGLTFKLHKIRLSKCPLYRSTGNTDGISLTLWKASFTPLQSHASHGVTSDAQLRKGILSGGALRHLRELEPELCAHSEGWKLGVGTP